MFGFFAEGRDDLPVIASGGRYDALTRVLGQGRSIAAVGGVIRPEALVALQEGRYEFEAGHPLQRPIAGQNH